MMIPLEPLAKRHYTDSRGRIIASVLRAAAWRSTTSPPTGIAGGGHDRMSHRCVYGYWVQ